LALAALSLFSLGLLWGIGLAESKRIWQTSEVRSIAVPTFPREHLSWNDEMQTKRTVYERSNKIIGGGEGTN
jgi:hypothetical protein